jgi:hypothetical protein
LVSGVLTFGNHPLPVPLHGAHNAQILERSPDQGLGDTTSPDGQGGPEGLANQGIKVQGITSERPEAGTDSSSIPASDVPHVYATSLKGQREGVSFTKDNRGGGI